MQIAATMPASTAALTVLAISVAPLPDIEDLQHRIHPAIERRGGDDEHPDAAAALDQVSRPGRNGLRDRQRNETERDQVDRDDRQPRVTDPARSTGN